MFLLSAELQDQAATRGFSFELPVLEKLGRLEFSQPVTLFVGENGSGKSTLLEALAYASERVTVGSQSVAEDLTLSHSKDLANLLRLSWSQRTGRGFFLRAEDFFGYIKRQNSLKTALAAELERTRLEYAHLPDAELARISAPYAGSIAALTARYGDNLDANSHGESFMTFFAARLTGAGLYILDEPEAALSPLRQLAFLSLLKEAVAQGAQFIIATHAPILMAYPGAAIIELKEGRPQRVTFDDLEHVKLLRDFLTAPEAFLRHL